MTALTKETVWKIWRYRPAAIGRMIGFKDLTDELHGKWMQNIIYGDADYTLQAHRLSYKSSCLSVALAMWCVLNHGKNALFMRKTDTDVIESIAQAQKVMENEAFRHMAEILMDSPVYLTTGNASNMTVSTYDSPRGAEQLVGCGCGGSLTGKHANLIVCDDVVNLQDRISMAEREKTKAIVRELRNIVTRDGRIVFIGTPWHKEDAFSLVATPERYDCYSTGLISEEKLKNLREAMTASLFAANYELRHIASDDVIFTSPQTGADPALAEQGICHIDASYGGEDGTAFTICKKSGGKYYIYGRLWQKHVDDCLPEIIRLRKAFNAGIIYCERNADKGYLAKTLREKGERADTYHEKTNKFVKITSYLKSEWKNVVFIAGTDAEYINQICDYTENAEHDDAPDSAASIVRKLWNKKDTEYVPLWM
jgi:predicted phage terminase large subunit-like protein